MKAIRVHEPGGSDKLKFEDCPTPEIKPDEVLIKTHATGVNFIDIYIREGLYPPSQYPYIPGKEGSGIIVAKGADVNSVVVDDKVAFAFGGSGSYAEYIAVPAEQVVKIPDALDFETAAASMLQGLTAHYLTHSTFPLKPGHTILIHAGAGGVGLLVIQLGKLLNCEVFTTVSTAAKGKLAKDAGADHVILYTQDDFAEKVRQLTNNKGVDVVYDAVGKTTFDKSLSCLKKRGMLVSFGQASGSIPPFNVARLSQLGSLFLTRPSLADYIATPQELQQRANSLFDYIVNKGLNIKIGQRLPLSDAAFAQSHLEQRKTVGKTILLP